MVRFFYLKYYAGREVKLIKNIVFVLTILILCGLTAIPDGSADESIIDFENLHPGYEAYGAMPLDYAGFSWTGGEPYWVTKYYKNGTGFEFGTVGNVSLYTAFGSDISLTDGYFNFTGAYITSAWNTGHEVTVEGWADGVNLYTRDIVTSYDVPYWFDFNYSAVDTVWFKPGTGTNAGLGGSGEMIVIDEITVTSVIPEPVSSILFVTGGVALGLRHFRKKRRTAGRRFRRGVSFLS